MAQFVNDTFTQGTGVELSLHTGEIGATWTQHPVSLGTMQNEGPSGIVHQTGGTFSLYYASGLPAGGEYDVEADIVTQAVQDLFAGIVGRADTVAETMYRAYYNIPDTSWYLDKEVSGTATTLGTFSQALSDGVTYHLLLQIRNATKKLFVDGVERVSSADNAIVATGRVGLVSRSNNLKLDNFSATDAAAPPTPPDDGFLVPIATFGSPSVVGTW